MLKNALFVCKITLRPIIKICWVVCMIEICYYLL